MKISRHVAAIEEIVKAADYFNEQDPRLGGRFIQGNPSDRRHAARMAANQTRNKKANPGKTVPIYYPLQNG